MINIDEFSEGRIDKIYEDTLGLLDQEVGKIKRSHKDNETFFQSNQLLIDISACCEEKADQFFVAFCNELQRYIDSSVVVSESNLKKFVSRFIEYVEYFREELRDTMSETALVSKQKGQDDRFSPQIENKVYKLQDKYEREINRIIASKSAFNLAGFFKSRVPASEKA